MSKTYFISSDTHSHLTPLLAALMKEGYDKTNPDHVLIIIGDLFDRGTESRQLYDFIRSIPRSNRILIRGNHEEIILNIADNYLKTKDVQLSQLDIIRGGYFDYSDYQNGTIRTLCSFFGNGHNDYECYDNIDLQKTILEAFVNSELYSWLKSDEWCDYYELGHYILEHAFIPLINTTQHHIYELAHYKYLLLYNPDWRTNSTPNQLNQSRWGCPWQLYKEGLFDEEKKKGKILVCGHWHTSDFFINLRNKNEKELGIDYRNKIEDTCPIFKKKGYNIIGIDACTAYTKRANVLVLKEEDL